MSVTVNRQGRARQRDLDLKTTALALKTRTVTPDLTWQSGSD